MKLSEQGVIEIEGELIEQDGVLFALSESGDLIVDEFIEVDNTSELLIELGGDRFTLHGKLIELGSEPP